jgi:hypothetical protein
MSFGRSMTRLVVGHGNGKTERMDEAMIARFDTTAVDGTIGAKHGRVDRGDNACRAAHNGGARGGDLLERERRRQPWRGRAGHRRELRRRVEQLRTRRGEAVIPSKSKITVRRREDGHDQSK